MLNDKIEQKIKWEKTDDENQKINIKQSLNTNLLYNILKSKFRILYIKKTSIIVTFIIGFTLFWYKPNIL